MDGHAGMMGEWVPPSPSTKAFFSSLFGGDEEVSSGPMPSEARIWNSAFDQGLGFEDNNVKQRGISFDNDVSMGPLPVNKTSSLGGLADRIAARAGFTAPRLNTENIRLTDRSSTDQVKSHYLTIPSGISPTALLESPVFLSNSLTQASPTTGKFPLFPDGNGNFFTVATHDQSKEDVYDDVNDSSSFAFKPHSEPGVPFSLAKSPKMSQVMNPQAFSNFEVSVRSENNVRNFEPLQVHTRSLADKEHEEKNAGSEVRSVDTTSGTADHSPPLTDQQDDEGEQVISGDSMAGGLAEDVYNWRKYGQKQVKGSEFPRSYYKCTHLNCPVKKKVERSHEGHITEIIYRGDHNHPKPVPNRRLSMGSNQFDDNHGQVAHENDSVREAEQNGLLPGTREWRIDSFEHNSSTLMNADIRKPPSSLQKGAVVESGDAADPSSTFSNDEGEDNHGTHGSLSIANDVEEDESESKRRKTETYAAEVGSGATRAIREPRVVVQTTSDIDILDDGYRWRKYGQKVVKGNPNPRSYYKCTNIGCSVRKHVERASHDLKSVITTYEGKHNHDVPAARNSSHVNSSASFASQPQTLIPRPNPSQFTNMARYIRPPLSSFNMPMVQPLGPPPHGFLTGMNQSNPANLSMAGMGPGQNKFPSMPVHPYLMQHQQQQRQPNDIGFMMPNGEDKVETNSAPNLYLSNGSSVYHQIMNKLPLGP